MRNELFEQYEVIEEQDKAEFKRALNEGMRLHKHQHPKSQIEIAGPTWRAVITYTEEIFFPEDLSDEFYLEGKSYKCGQCPHFKLPENDKRVRHIFCSEDGNIKRRCKDDGACDYILEKIKRGEVTI